MTFLKPNKRKPMKVLANLIFRGKIQYFGKRQPVQANVDRRKNFRQNSFDQFLPKCKQEAKNSV